MESSREDDPAVLAELDRLELERLDLESDEILRVMPKTFEEVLQRNDLLGAHLILSACWIDGRWQPPDAPHGKHELRGGNGLAQMVIEKYRSRNGG
jgi:hypothetical protein